MRGRGRLGEGGQTGQGLDLTSGPLVHPAGGWPLPTNLRTPDPAPRMPDPRRLQLCCPTDIAS